MDLYLGGFEEVYGENMLYNYIYLEYTVLSYFFKVSLLSEPLIPDIQWRPTRGSWDMWYLLVLLDQTPTNNLQKSVLQNTCLANSCVF